MNKVKFKPNEFNYKVLPKLLEHVSSLDDGDYELRVVKVRKDRSLTQNAYFHALVGELSDVTGKGFDEIKSTLNTDYGTIAKDDDGKTIGFMLPSSVDPATIYKYTRWFDTRNIDGVEFNCYIAYKETHLLNTKEMTKLIQGTMHECEQYGIEVLSASELALLEGK